VCRYAQALIIVAQPFVKITEAIVFKVFIIAIITLQPKGMFFVFVKSTIVIRGKHTGYNLVLGDIVWEIPGVSCQLACSKQVNKSFNLISLEVTWFLRPKEPLVSVIPRGAILLST
jgi:hypothetical protein